jgi:hypothetical protein
MYRALYQQICSSDQLLHTSTNIAKNLTQREKKTERKKRKMSKSKFNRICLKERIHREKKTKKNLFCVFMRTDFLLWVFYTERRKIRIIWKISEFKFIRICLKKYFHREKKD